MNRTEFYGQLPSGICVSIAAMDMDVYMPEGTANDRIIASLSDLLSLY